MQWSDVTNFVKEMQIDCSNIISTCSHFRNFTLECKLNMKMLVKSVEKWREKTLDGCTNI